MELEKLPLISAEKINEILDYKSLTDAVSDGLGTFSLGKQSGIHQPVRSVIHVPKHQGIMACMPVYSERHDILTTKLLTFYPNNKNMDTHRSLLIAFDSNNGLPKAILDGDIITAKRTAAASAVATKHLVNGEPQTLAILGSGVQARSHFEALSQLYTFKQIKIWNHRIAGAEKLAAEIGDCACAFEECEEAVKDADVIVTVTSAKEPVLKKDWVKKGTHINCVGAPRPDWSEIDPELMRSSFVYVDSREGALKESGDIISSNAKIFAEIGEVVNGTADAKCEEITIFKSLGMAIEDGVAAKLVMDHLGL